jgi:TPR repeat protein
MVENGSRSKVRRAIYRYGLCLFTESGVETNHIEAVKYFKEAANEKDGSCFSALGICSLFGFGC